VGSFSFLTPLSALVALVGVLPLLAFLERERRGRRVRETLGLADPPSGPARMLVTALVALPMLAGVAAAQPVIDRSKPLRERTDAEIFFVLDTSRSMLAANAPDDPTRLDRARSDAIAIRARLARVPAGIAEITDWTIPHLFPTIDATTFDSTLARSVYVGALGSRNTGVVTTNLSALAAFARDDYFSPGVRKRLLLVFTDGESEKLEPRLAALSRAGIHTLFVHVWGAHESIWRPEGAEPQYRPDATSKQTLAQVATLVDGAVFDESDLAGVVARVREDLGEGPTRTREQRDLLALMPYVMLAMLAPLGLLLRHRNL
jgi:hypothetical protein